MKSNVFQIAHVEYHFVDMMTCRDYVDMTPCRDYVEIYKCGNTRGTSTPMYRWQWKVINLETNCSVYFTIVRHYHPISNEQDYVHHMQWDGKVHRSSIPAKSLIYGPFTMCLLSVVYLIPRRDSNFGPISSVCDFCLFSIMEHKHHTKVCTETLYILISIHFTSKFEESQRNWRFYSRHNNASRWSLTNGRSYIHSDIMRAKIPNGIFHYELRLVKMILPQLLCRE